MTKTREVRLVAVVLSAVLAAVLMALVAPASQATGKPDLVVASPELTSQDYVFSGEESTFSFKDTTKNRGSAKAGPSKTALELRDSLLSIDPGIVVASRDVPGLKKKGGSNRGNGSAKGALTRGQIGTYYALVCADNTDLVSESHEFNNCKDTDERMSVIPQSWSGTVTGSGVVLDGVTESWTTQSLTFRFDRYDPASRFFHYTAYGDVKYSISGTDAAGCTWSGGGTATLVNHGELILPVGFAWYEGLDQIDPFYNITVSCPNGGGSTAQMGPFNGTWFDTGTSTGHIAQIQDPVGVTSLEDHYEYPSSTGDGPHYDWAFTAD